YREAALRAQATPCVARTSRPNEVEMVRRGQEPMVGGDRHLFGQRAKSSGPERATGSRSPGTGRGRRGANDPRGAGKGWERVVEPRSWKVLTMAQTPDPAPQRQLAVPPVFQKRARVVDWIPQPYVVLVGVDWRGRAPRQATVGE